MIVLHHIESVFSVGRNLESFNFFTPSRTALNILDDLQSPLTNSTCIESVTAFGPVHPLIYLSETSLCPVLQDLENNIGTPWNGWNPLPCFSNLRFVYTLHTLIASKGPVQWTKDNSGGAMGDAGMLDTLNTWQGYHLQCPSWSLAMQYGHTRSYCDTFLLCHLQHPCLLYGGKHHMPPGQRNNRTSLFLIAHWRRKTGHSHGAIVARLWSMKHRDKWTANFLEHIGTARATY